MNNLINNAKIKKLILYGEKLIETSGHINEEARR